MIHTQPLKDVTDKQPQNHLQQSPNIPGINSASQLRSITSIIGNSAALCEVSKVIQMTVQEDVPSNAKREYDDNGTTKYSEIQNKRGKLTGSPPSGQPIGWDQINMTYRTTWVRFHLVNENIGGEGTAANLVPTTKLTNSCSEWRNFEDKVKDQFNKGRWVWCKSSVNSFYPSTPGFPEEIAGEAAYYDAGTWTDIAELTLPVAPPPDFSAGIPLKHVNTMTKADWKQVFGFDKISGECEAMEALFLSRGRHFSDINDCADFISEQLNEQYDNDLSEKNYQNLIKAAYQCNPRFNIDIT